MCILFCKTLVLPPTFRILWLLHVYVGLVIFAADKDRNLVA